MKTKRSSRPLNNSKRHDVDWVFVNKELNRILAENRQVKYQKHAPAQINGCHTQWIFPEGMVLLGASHDYITIGSCHPDSVSESFIFGTLPFRDHTK